MDASENLNQSVAQTSFVGGDRTQISNQYSHREASASVSTASNQEPFFPTGLIIISVLFVTALFLSFLNEQLNFWKPSGNRSKFVKGSRQAPCPNCQFYQNNPYLKCAVHPSIVLSAEAKDCPDYRPK